jgi:hypothetical protein
MVKNILLVYMTRKQPSVFGFLFLLASLTFLYIIIISPFATGAYYALKDDKYQEFSDNIIRNIKRKLKFF